MFFLNRPTAILNLLWTKKEFGAFSIRHLTTYDVDEEKVLVAKKIVVGDNIQHSTWDRRRSKYFIYARAQQDLRTN